MRVTIDFETPAEFVQLLDELANAPRKSPIARLAAATPVVGAEEAPVKQPARSKSKPKSSKSQTPESAKLTCPECGQPFVHQKRLDNHRFVAHGVEVPK